MLRLSNKIIFWLMHHFAISVCETVSQFNDKWPNLMKGRGTKEVEQLKSLSLKIPEATSKSVAVTYVRHTNQEHLPTIINPVNWLYRWSSHSVWCSSCRKYFGRWLQSFQYENHWDSYKKLASRSWPVLFILTYFFLYIHSPHLRPNN